MSIMRKPKTYPAALSESYHILKSLYDGAEFKLTQSGYKFDTYETAIDNYYMRFYMRGNEFLRIKLHARSDIDTNLVLKVITKTWKVHTDNSMLYNTRSRNSLYELPLDKDQHFNAMLTEQSFPEWDDMIYVNKMYEVSVKLGIERVWVNVDLFYP